MTSDLKRTIVLAILAVMLGRCSSEGLAHGPSRFRPGFDPSCRNEPASPRLPIQVIVDDSKSMIGFIRADQSGASYWHKLGNVLDELASARHIESRRLSQLSKIVQNTRVMAETDFYGDDQTPLTAAFDYVARAGAAPVVIVSDLQQDEGEKGFNALADALRAAVITHPYVLIVGNQLPYLPRSRKRCERLLYVVIMSTTLEDYESLDAYTGVKSRSLGSQSIEDVKAERPKGPFLFNSQPFITIQRVDEDYAGSQGWQHQDARVVYCRPSPVVVWSALVYLAKDAPPPARFRVEATTTMPVRSPEQVNVTLCEELPPRNDGPGICQPVVLEGGGKPAKVWAFTSHDSTGLTERNDLKFEVDYQLPFAPGRDHARYRAELSLGEGNVEPPDWVSKWTTVDLTDPSKTLHLQGILNTVIRTVTERDVFLVHSIDLVRGTAP